jgi:hypothetical protein
MPSQFAATIELELESRKQAGGFVVGSDEDEPPPPNVRGVPQTLSAAPVIHLTSKKGALLVDYPYGRGRIVVLSDPYVFSNGGIQLADNVILALNILGRAGGLVAFDEFHQGRGVTSNPLISYFAGTPVLALAGQLALLILLILWTQSRRFARPLPLPKVDRRSSLEFVASMAEVQQRARAYDLAIENVYARTRRVLARYAGMEYNSPRSLIATGVASRSSVDARQLEVLMRRCEEAINGQAITEKQSLDLVRKLRQLEIDLGLRMRSRDVKQARQ